MVEAESVRVMVVRIVAAEQAFLLVGGGGALLLGLVTASSVTSPSWLPASERGCQRLCCHRAARSCHGLAGRENKERGGRRGKGEEVDIGQGRGKEGDRGGGEP